MDCTESTKRHRHGCISDNSVGCCNSKFWMSKLMIMMDHDGIINKNHHSAVFLVSSHQLVLGPTSMYQITGSDLFLLSNLIETYKLLAAHTLALTSVRMQAFIHLLLLVLLLCEMGVEEHGEVTWLLVFLSVHPFQFVAVIRIRMLY